MWWKGYAEIHIPHLQFSLCWFFRYAQNSIRGFTYFLIWLSSTRTQLRKVIFTHSKKFTWLRESICPASSKNCINKRSFNISIENTCLFVSSSKTQGFSEEFQFLYERNRSRDKSVHIKNSNACKRIHIVAWFHKATILFFKNFYTKEEKRLEITAANLSYWYISELLQRFKSRIMKSRWTKLSWISRSYLRY